MAFKLDEWYNKLNGHNTIVAFKGYVDSDVVSEKLEELEEKLGSMNLKVGRKKKVYNVLVEALQNLYHHSEPAPDANRKDKNYVAFVVNKQADQTFRVITGNYVHSQKKKMLKDRLDQINFLSKSELKSLYKLILSNKEFSDKGGGGLGMIDIARKSGNKFQYNFYQIDADNHFYVVSIEV